MIIGYLSIYSKKHSIRIYFVTIAGTLWMLAIDADKRRMKLTDGFKKTLLTRLSDVKADAAKLVQKGGRDG